MDEPPAMPEEKAWLILQRTQYLSDSEYDDNMPRSTVNEREEEDVTAVKSVKKNVAEENTPKADSHEELLSSGALVVDGQYISADCLDPLSVEESDEDLQEMKQEQIIEFIKTTIKEEPTDSEEQFFFNLSNSYVVKKEETEEEISVDRVKEEPFEAFPPLANTGAPSSSKGDLPIFSNSEKDKMETAGPLIVKQERDSESETETALHHLSCASYVLEASENALSDPIYRETNGSEEDVESAFHRGDLVFAKMRGHPPWPSRVEYIFSKSAKLTKYCVFFFGTSEFGVCNESEMYPYEESKARYGRPLKKKGFRQALVEIKEAAFLLNCQRNTGNTFPKRTGAVNNSHIQGRVLYKTGEMEQENTFFNIVKPEVNGDGIDIEETFLQIKKEVENSCINDACIKPELEDSMTVSNRSQDASMMSMSMEGQISFQNYNVIEAQKTRIVVDKKMSQRCFSLKQSNCSKDHLQIHAGEKPFKCKHCGKTFSQKCNLKVHVRYHTGEKPFNCKICERAFADQSTLIKHNLTHTDERPYKCHKCNSAFKRNSHLANHMWKHADELPFKCDACGKSFIRKVNFTNHMCHGTRPKTSQTQEMPFKCNECKKTFNRKDSLKDHILRHTSAKPFVCSLCKKGFLYKTSLTKHVRIHTGEKPFKCNHCGKAFRRKDGLTDHIRTHTDERPYACSLCERRFNTSGNLTSHRRIAHSASLSTP